jgi:hypothetical protein
MENEMSGILQSLNTVAASKRNTLSPVQHRRNKLIAKIHEQLNAAKARQAGQRYTVTQVRRLKNKETGEVRELTTERPVRESWWIGNAGRVFVELRYGVKPLEFAKGKNAIEVGNLDELVTTLEKLKMATEAGEFDDQLTTVAGRFDKQIAGSKKSAK